jgi:Mor family transcriptional regulator
MSYQKAENILPSELVELIQNYIDGEYIYIPRKRENRKYWGEGTSTRSELNRRDYDIYNDYSFGMNISSIAEKYYLSEKSIQRIILKEKNKNCAHAGHTIKNKSM